MADWIQTFSQLDARQRQHVLARLPAELTPYEWRDLHAITSSRLFHADIIGRLPIELVAHVFSYLDPAAPYRCQSVSRRWHHVLRSLDVLRTTLGSWFQGTLPLQDAHYASCVQTTSSIQRFRTGRPVSRYKVAVYKNMVTPQLFGDHLIWKLPWRQSQPRMIHVLNLHTWQLRHLAGDGHEALFNLVASDQLVVLSTATNVCYVFELHNVRPAKRFSLPSTQFLKYVACHGRTVACAALYETHTSVFIWDYDTQRGTSFDITHGPGSVFAAYADRKIRHIAPVVHGQTQTVSFVFLMGDLKEKVIGNLIVLSTTYSFRGDFISSSSPSLSDMGQMVFWPGENLFVPVDDSNTLFALRLHALREGREPIWARSGSLVFEFNVKTRDLGIFKASGLRRHSPSVCFGDSLTWWKDTCYGFKLETEATSGNMLTYMGTRDKEAYVPIFSEEKYDHTHWGSDTHQPLLLNEKYAIRIVPGALYLACFQESSNRPTGESDFFSMGNVHVL